jgi:phenylpropionate dioxygenase-like ring-hydroxylating dioxygenase large terminal subunit
MAESGPDLPSYLGPEIREAFDNMIDRAPDGEIEIAGGRTVQRYRANWKLQMENSIDLLHPRILHRNAVDAIGEDLPLGADGLPVPDMDFLKANGISFRQWNEVQVEALPGGHCWMGGFLPKADPNAKIDDRLRFRQQDEYKRLLAARHGQEKAEQILAFNRHNTIIYPNLFINPRMQQIRFVVPVKVNETEQHGFLFRYKGAPEASFQLAVRLLMAANSPASLVTTDDHEVFERMQESMENGTRPWIDWSRDYGAEKPTNRGLTAGGTGELLMRNQFREWVRCMTLAQRVAA